MFERIIRFAIEQRWLVILAVLGMAALGGFSYQKLPIDAVPDITNVQVQVNTEAPGYSPLEAEQRITFIVETALAGLPNLSYTRSISRYGLSQVTAVFDRLEAGRREQLSHRVGLVVAMLQQQPAAGFEVVAGLAHDGANVI